MALTKLIGSLQRGYCWPVEAFKGVFRWRRKRGSVMLISFKKIDFVPSSLDVNVESLLRHIYIYMGAQKRMVF